jgi:hypothetical protein
MLSLTREQPVAALVPSAPNQTPLWRLAKFVRLERVPEEVGDKGGRNSFEVAVIELHDGTPWLATCVQLQHG